eukprot:5516215-Pyramimonas_sp.AAC.1
MVSALMRVDMPSPRLFFASCLPCISIDPLIYLFKSLSHKHVYFFIVVCPRLYAYAPNVVRPAVPSDGPLGDFGKHVALLEHLVQEGVVRGIEWAVSQSLPGVTL